MRRLARVALVTAVALSNVTCSVNILENFADKNTNNAYIVDATKLINSGDYDAALEKLNLITGAAANDRKVKSLKASAYAGKCGLVFLPFVEALAAMGTTRLFPFLNSAFRAGTTTTKIDSCTTAEGLIESIGTTAERTSDENMLLVLVAFAKMGNILSYYADEADGLQDGTVGGAYNVCTIGGARTLGGNIPSVDIDELVWSTVSAINNITAVTADVDLGDASLASISSACSSLPLAYNFCSITSRSDITADFRKGMRSLLIENSAVGLGLSAGGFGVCPGDLSSCVCP